MVNGTTRYADKATTHFGRYYFVHNAFVKRGVVLPRTGARILVVGPGVERSTLWPKMQTSPFVSYEPFEIINTLMRMNLQDFALDVIDINPNMVKAVRETRFIQTQQAGFCYDVPQLYIDEFFEGDSKGNKEGRLITLPEAACASIGETNVLDIFEDNIPGKEFYDLIWCLNVLPNHQPFNLKILKQAAEKLLARLKANGLLVTEAIEPFVSHFRLQGQRINFAIPGVNRLPIAIFTAAG